MRISADVRHILLIGETRVTSKTHKTSLFFQTISCLVVYSTSKLCRNGLIALLLANKSSWGLLVDFFSICANERISKTGWATSPISEEPSELLASANDTWHIQQILVVIVTQYKQHLLHHILSLHTDQFGRLVHRSGYSLAWLHLQTPPVYILYLLIGSRVTFGHGLCRYVLCVHSTTLARGIQEANKISKHLNLIHIDGAAVGCGYLFWWILMACWKRGAYHRHCSNSALCFCVIWDCSAANWAHQLREVLGQLEGGHPWEHFQSLQVLPYSARCRKRYWGEWHSHHHLSGHPTHYTDLVACCCLNIDAAGWMLMSPYMCCTWTSMELARCWCHLTHEHRWSWLDADVILRVQELHEGCKLKAIIIPPLPNELLICPMKWDL